MSASYRNFVGVALHRENLDFVVGNFAASFGGTLGAQLRPQDPVDPRDRGGRRGC